MDCHWCNWGMDCGHTANHATQRPRLTYSKELHNSCRQAELPGVALRRGWSGSRPMYRCAATRICSKQIIHLPEHDELVLADALSKHCNVPTADSSHGLHGEQSNQDPCNTLSNCIWLPILIQSLGSGSSLISLSFCNMLF